MISRLQLFKLVTVAYNVKMNFIKNIVTNQSIVQTQN